MFALLCEPCRNFFPRFPGHALFLRGDFVDAHADGFDRLQPLVGRPFGGQRAKWLFSLGGSINGSLQRADGEWQYWPPI